MENFTAKRLLPLRWPELFEGHDRHGSTPLFHTVRINLLINVFGNQHNTMNTPNPHTETRPLCVLGLLDAHPTRHTVGAIVDNAILPFETYGISLRFIFKAWGG